MLDFEGETPRTAVFYAENCPFAQASLGVRNSYIGTVGKDAAVFRLLDYAPMDGKVYRPRTCPPRTSRRSTTGRRTSTSTAPPGTAASGASPCSTGRSSGIARSGATHAT